MYASIPKKRAKTDMPTLINLTIAATLGLCLSCFPVAQLFGLCVCKQAQPAFARVGAH